MVDRSHEHGDGRSDATFVAGGTLVRCASDPTSPRWDRSACARGQATRGTAISLEGCARRGEAGGTSAARYDQAAGTCGAEALLGGPPGAGCATRGTAQPSNRGGTAEHLGAWRRPARRPTRGPRHAPRRGSARAHARGRCTALRVRSRTGRAARPSGERSGPACRSRNA